MPLVTVYVTTCNRMKLLKRCVESIVKQTIKDIDIIIVDDFSEDGTREYLHDISKVDSRIKYILNEKKMGACYSRNAAIKIARSKYITGCDDDDYFSPSRLEIFLNNKELLGKHALLYTDSMWVTSQGIRKANINKYVKNSCDGKDLLFFNFIGNQVFTKTKTLQNYLFDEKMPAWQDLECWYRILLNENSSAIKIESYNYYQDISHEFERISEGKIGRIEQAYNLFCRKYELSSIQREILKCHYFNYGIGKGTYLKSTLLSLIYRPSPFKFILAARNFKMLYL